MQWTNAMIFYGSIEALSGVTDLSATLFGNAGSVSIIKHKPTTSILYELDSHNKYSIAVNIEGNFMFSKNPYFDWSRCTFQALEDLPSQKKQAARDNMRKEVMLNMGGRRKASFKVEIISVAKGTDHDFTILLLYQQDETMFGQLLVWL